MAVSDGTHPPLFVRTTQRVNVPFDGAGFAVARAFAKRLTEENSGPVAGWDGGEAADLIDFAKPLRVRRIFK